MTYMTYIYIYTNKDILNLCKTEDIIPFVHRQQTNYLAHLARQTNKTLTKRLLFNDDRNNKAGRPLVTLEEQVLNNINMTQDEFYRHALKRDLNMVGLRP